MDIRFIRRGDGLTYAFVAGPDGVYRRTDADLRCLRLTGFGWCVVDSAGTVLSRPFDDPGLGELPPEGVWVSRKGDRSYVYDLFVAPASRSG